MNKWIKILVIVRNVLYNYYINYIQGRCILWWTTNTLHIQILWLIDTAVKIWAIFSTWRKIWVALAEGEKELGINITEEQLDELRNNIDNINFDEARKIEKEVRHDVMSHVKAYGLQCDKAKGIIHLGATSAYVGDNTDVIQMNEALKLIRVKLVNLINNLKEFSLKYKDVPTLGFTHFQAAQLTTVGKRATLCAQD